MPKLNLEVRLSGTFRAADDEREFSRRIRRRLERLVEEYLVEYDATHLVRLEEVTASKVEPDYEVDRSRKRGKTDGRS